MTRNEFLKSSLESWDDLRGVDLCKIDYIYFKLLLDSELKFFCVVFFS